MRVTAQDLVAGIIDRLEGDQTGRGRPRLSAADVVATLQFFLREGVQWCELVANPGRTSGSTLGRRLRTWHETSLLRRVHVVLMRMARSGPESAAESWDRVLDTCSVRAKRGGELTGPNPTDRGKRGTKYHGAVDGDGVPVACSATAANVNDTLVFERLFLAAFAVMARIRTVFADKGYDAEHHRDLCRAFGAKPQIHRRRRPHGSGLGKRRWPVKRSNAWLLDNRRLALRYDRLGFIIQSLLQAACIFLVAGRLASQF